MKREASDDAGVPPAAKHARTSTVLSVEHTPSLIVKESVKELFEQQCKDHGWTPNELTQRKISDLLGIDRRRTDSVEPVLFAFVQHLKFLWIEDALFIGSKMINRVQRLVFYKPQTPGGSVGDNLWLNGSQRMSFLQKYTPSIDHVLVERFWPSYKTAFGLSSRKGDYRYISGVYTVLLTFPKLRQPCSEGSLRRWADGLSTDVPEHDPPRKFELPFLHESVWMSKELAPSRGRLTPRPETPSSRPFRRAFAEIRSSSNILDPEPTSVNGRLDSTLRQSSSIRNAQARGDNLRHTVEDSIERTTEASETISETATDDVAVSENQSPLVGLNAATIDQINRLLQSPQIHVSATAPGQAQQAQVQLTVTFPANIVQPQSALQFSTIVSVGLAPIVPPRRLVLQALCALAMSASDDSAQ